MSNLRPIAPGDRVPLSAANWNLLMQMARDYQRGKFSAGAPMADLQRKTGIVRVFNSSAGDRDRGEIIGIGAPQIPDTANEREFLNTQLYVGETAELTTHFHKFGVCLEPIAEGQIGRVVVDGVAHAKISGGATSVTVAGPNGNGVLEPSLPGVQVLSRTTDWAVVRFSEDYRVEGLLDSDLTTGSSAQLSVYGYPSGTWADTGENVTVQWPSGVGPSSPDILTGTWVLAAWINGQWRPIAADC